MTKIKPGITLYQETVNSMDRNLQRANCRSRNEFTEKALRFYIGYLNKEDDAEYISKALQSVITGTVQVSEDRIAGLLFKLAVEMSMMMHILAANLDVDNQILDRLRCKCVQDVKRSIGSVDFKRVTNYQKNNS